MSNFLLFISLEWRTGLTMQACGV